MSRVVALIATIPRRQHSCARLLEALTQQTRRPDLVALVLDGYGATPAPPGPWPAREYRTAAPSGPGQRWRVWCDFAPDDLLVTLDDDAVLDDAPGLIAALSASAEQHGGAAAAMGYTPNGRRAAAGHRSQGHLVLGAGCGLAVRAGHLDGLQARAAQVRAAGAPDPLGPCGDDQALVSAHLFCRGVPLVHAATGPLSFTPDTQRESETQARRARGERTFFEQAQAIARVTGWPLPAPVIRGG